MPTVASASCCWKRKSPIKGADSARLVFSSRSRRIDSKASAASVPVLVFFLSNSKVASVAPAPWASITRALERKSRGFALSVPLSSPSLSSRSSRNRLACSEIVLPAPAVLASTPATRSRRRLEGITPSWWEPIYLLVALLDANPRLISRAGCLQSLGTRPRELLGSLARARGRTARPSFLVPRTRSRRRRRGKL